MVNSRGKQDFTQKQQVFTSLDLYREGKRRNAKKEKREKRPPFLKTIPGNYCMVEKKGRHTLLNTTIHSLTYTHYRQVI